MSRQATILAALEAADLAEERFAHSGECSSDYAVAKRDWP